MDVQFLFAEDVERFPSLCFMVACSLENQEPLPHLDLSVFSSQPYVPVVTFLCYIKELLIMGIFSL